MQLYKAFPSGCEKGGQPPSSLWLLAMFNHPHDIDGSYCLQIQYAGFF